MDRELTDHTPSQFTQKKTSAAYEGGPETVSRETPPREKLYAALAKAQGAIHHAVKDAENPHFRSKFADLAAIWDVIRKPFSDNGLCVVQATVVDPEGGLWLETTLGHSSGQSITGRLPIKLGTPQQIGSEITYMRRYELQSMAGVAAEVDDDGEAAEAPHRHNSRPPAAKAPPPATMTPAELGEQSIGFGKFKGKKLKEVKPVEMRAWFEYLASNGTGLSPQAQNLKAAAERFWAASAAHDHPPAANHEEPVTKSADPDIPF